MARDARDRDRRRDADEDQQRRHQEPAADAEHAGNESDREPHEEDQQDIDGQFGDRKVDLHETGSADARAEDGRAEESRSLVGFSGRRAERYVQRG